MPLVTGCRGGNLTTKMCTWDVSLYHDGGYVLIHKYMYSLALLSLVVCSLRYPDMYYGRIELFEMPG